MPKRKEVIVTKEIYHVFNKSIDNKNIFLTKYFIASALKRIRYYKFNNVIKYSDFIEYKKDINNSEKANAKLVDIFAYALMPNHYHFVLKELENNGIRRFISRFQMSFAWLYNKRVKRSGSVFQGRFKAKLIKNDQVLLHIVRYIHLNPVTAYMLDFENLKKSNTTSFQEYLSEAKGKLINKNVILKEFKNLNTFQSFHEDQIDYQRKLSSIKKILLD
ncbi:MAG: transposase [bacterium]